MDGHMRQLICEQQFDARGPYIVNIPADAPHAFVNIGTSPLRLICFFSTPEIWAGMVGRGPNPLVNVSHAAPPE
jgi:hypothetical protein